MSHNANASGPAPKLRGLRGVGLRAWILLAGGTLLAALAFRARLARPEPPAEGEVIAVPGTLLGESALLLETRRPASATAREDSTVLRISRTMFLKMLESFPDAAQRLREMMASRADQWGREIENVRAALTRETGPQ